MASVSMNAVSTVDGLAKAKSPNQRLGGSQSFSEVLSSRELQPTQNEYAQPSLASRFVENMDAGRKRIDQIIAQARNGKRFNPGELLALQAEVHQISEEISLANKLVEQGVSGLRRLWSVQL
jgi:hypothetical protein